MNKKAEPGTAYEPTGHEQIANIITHGVGIVPSLLVAQTLVNSAHRELQYNLMIVYGFFTTLIFTTSTLYHISEFLFRPRRRKLRYYLHISDRAGWCAICKAQNSRDSRESVLVHSAIYFFIAASATPWLSLRNCGYLGVDLKYIVWLFALIGVAYQLAFHEQYRSVETFLYILNAVIPYAAILTMNDRTGTPLMLFSGAIYAVGLIFFKLDGVIPFAHSIWHLHVLAASFIQAYAVYVSLLGPDKYNSFLAEVHFEIAIAQTLVIENSDDNRNIVLVQ